MMSLANILIIASCLGMSHGMTCEWPGTDSNIVSKIVNHCPGPLDTSDKSYCCVDQNGNFQCCDLLQFGLTYIIIAAVACLLLSLICSLICCCCCPCCCLYKRRHGNVV